MIDLDGPPAVRGRIIAQRDDVQKPLTLRTRGKKDKEEKRQTGRKGPSPPSV
ncbi:MAG: hypothetical protein OXH70_05500 [Acidobacteria bacterium]|nr:hypothetical protein [Acidobacteriota bacterium]